MNSALNSAITNVSRELGINREIVETVYRSYWGFIRNHLDNLELKSLSSDEFDNTDTNFNIPFIGKLYTTYDKIAKYQRRLNYYKNYVKDKKDTANRQSSASDKKCV